MKGEGRDFSVLWLMAAGANVAFLLFLLHAFGVAGIFHRPHQPLHPQDDLPLNSPIPSPLRPLLDRQKPLLIVAFGRCSQCTVHRLGEWVMMLQRWSDQVKGVIVAAEGEGVLRKLWEEREWKVAYVADGKGEILRALNAWFLPRAYGFNPKGELVWRQESPEGSDLEAIRAVVEAVRGKEYARKVFDRPPAWKDAWKEKKAGEER
ncbi:MAG: hypothetical protein RRB24_04005 [Armatimonadota bacterium]|nr:hypothetical protein [Armatimonadota bacterium]MDT7971971.1 hypothetical protein [Armatimonadota bacterium]